MMEWAFIKEMTPGGAGIWVLVFMAFVQWLKGWPVLKKIQVEADGSLRTDLMKLLADERVECAKAMAEMRLDYAKALTDMRADYEGRMTAQGRQIDALQRELFSLRNAASAVVDHRKPITDENPEITKLVERFGNEDDVK